MIRMMIINDDCGDGGFGMIRMMMVMMMMIINDDCGDGGYGNDKDDDGNDDDYK